MLCQPLVGTKASLPCRHLPASPPRGACGPSLWRGAQAPLCILSTAQPCPCQLAGREWRRGPAKRGGNVGTMKVPLLELASLLVAPRKGSGLLLGGPCRINLPPQRERLGSRRSRGVAGAGPSITLPPTPPPCGPATLPGAESQLATVADEYSCGGGLHGRCYGANAGHGLVCVLEDCAAVPQQPPGTPLLTRGTAPAFGSSALAKAVTHARRQSSTDVLAAAACNSKRSELSDGELRWFRLQRWRRAHMRGSGAHLAPELPPTAGCRVGDAQTPTIRSTAMELWMRSG